MLRTLIRALAIGLALTLPAQLAVASGGWVATGSLHQPRNFIIVVALPAGGALAVGGTIPGTAGSTPIVEQYDPAAGLWTITGSMAEGRSRHAAVVLDDGRVLVAGGRGVNLSLRSAERYDPSTGLWTATGAMATPRDWHTLTKLADGRVLAVAGLSLISTNPNNPIEKSSELYDSRSGTWSVTEHLRNQRWGHTATLLQDGRVLVIGGGNPSGECQFVERAEIYDPWTGHWSETGGLNTPRGFHDATLLQDGRVLVTGGLVHAAGTCQVQTAAAEIYDPATGTFGSVAPMTSARNGHVSARLPDGRVLVAGGRTAGRMWTASTEIFDPATQSWSAASPLPVARNARSSAQLADGRVMIAGGNGALGVTANVVLYVP